MGSEALTYHERKALGFGTVKERVGKVSATCCSCLCNVTGVTCDPSRCMPCTGKEQLLEGYKGSCQGDSISRQGATVVVRPAGPCQQTQLCAEPSVTGLGVHCSVHVSAGSQQRLPCRVGHTMYCLGGLCVLVGAAGRKRHRKAHMHAR